VQKISEFAVFSHGFAGNSGRVNKPERKTASKNVSILQNWLRFLGCVSVSWASVLSSFCNKCPQIAHMQVQSSMYFSAAQTLRNFGARNNSRLAVFSKYEAH
jgi:hypothetical protein